MPNTVLIGAQWGDEGKGKIIDVMTQDADWVVRYQGGNNAGHTVKVDGTTYILHLIPSGILREEKRCIIGHGTVIDPIALLTEMDELHDLGVQTTGRLFFSDRAHMVMPYHRRIDELREAQKTGKDKIGTTKRGIGPAYGDKAARTGLRFGVLLENDLDAQVRQRVELNNTVIQALGGEPLDPEDVAQQYVAAAERLKPYVAETVQLLHDAIARGETFLCEGAQGTMLDIDYGTYPYVTSSNTTVGGATTGSGIPHKYIDRVVGVIKAYTTRVGEGPFPTELTDGIGELLQTEGSEFGATTGRPRRCGWFDAVIARYSAMLNGVDQWAMTKLDVLDKVETLRICTGYEHKGTVQTSMPAGARVLEECTPVYEEMPGWGTPTSEIRNFEDLPDAAKAYIHRLEEITGVPVGILSVGPGRDSTMVVKPTSRSAHG